MDLVDALHHPVGDRFADLHAGSLQYGRAKALNVLDVHRGKDIDPSGEQLHHIFKSLGVPAAVDVRMRQFVDQDDTRLASEDAVHVHLFTHCPLEFELAQRNLLELAGELHDTLAAVAIHYADGNLFAAARTAYGLADHAVGL